MISIVMTVTIKMAAVNIEVNLVTSIERDLDPGLKREGEDLDLAVETGLLEVEDPGLEAETEDLEVDLETETGVKVKVMTQ